MKRLLIVLTLALLSLAASAQYVDGGALREDGDLRGSGALREDGDLRGSGALRRAGATIRIGDQKLTAAERDALVSELGGTELVAAWDKARGGRSAGIWLTAGGAVLTSAGAVTALLGGMISVTGALVGATTGAIVGSIGGQESANQAASQAASNGAQAGNPYLTAGMVGMIAGVAGLAAGIPILVVNNHRLNALVDDCNQSRQSQQGQQARQAQLALAPTPHGLGLTLTF